MTDPLRSLFLDVGVEDQRTIASLRRITQAADTAERAFVAVAQAAKLAGNVGGLTRANDALAQSYSRVSRSARQAALDTFYLARAQFQVGRNVSVQRAGAVLDPAWMHLARQQAEISAGRMSPRWTPGQFMGGISPGAAGRGPYMPGYPQPGRRGAGGRGNYGLGTSIFLATAGVGAGAYAFGQSANLQRESLRASFASGQSASAMRAQSLALRSDFNLRLREASALTREVAQLGGLTPEGQQGIARAGAAFNLAEPEIAAGQASAAIYRLIKATSRSKEEFDAGTASALRYTGAIYAAGNESAAGAGAVFSMVQEIEPLAQIMRLGANGTIALSAAFADLNENQRELFRGALTRMAVEGKIDPNNPIASLLSIAERLRGAGSEAEKINILKALGFDNIRDIQTIAVMAASLDTFARSLEAVNDEMQGSFKFGGQLEKLLSDQQASWDGLKASMDAAAASILTSIAPALQLLMGMLAGLGDMATANPALALLMGIGGMGLAGAAIRGLRHHHFGVPEAVRLERLGLSGAEGAVRRGRLTEGLMGTLPFLGRRRAEAMTATRFGVALGEGASLGAGLGRMNRLSLGAMRMLPFVGERLSVAAAGAMAGGGVGGLALRAATGPVGWIVTALSLGAPLFERIGQSLSKMASMGGPLGVVLNTTALIFDVLAAGGRVLNRAFDWLMQGGKWLLDIVTAGHADDILGGINAGLQGTQQFIRGIAAEPKAGSQTPPKATAGVVNIYTDGSRSGMQAGIDEVSRRAARTMPTSTYGGIPV